MDLFILLCVLLIKTVTMETLKEDTGNIAETLKLLTISFDRMALDFHSLESRLETKMQKMHDELENKVTSWQTTALDTAWKQELTESIKPVIDDSVHKQAAIVYKTLSVEKRKMVKLRSEIQLDIANFKANTDNSLKVFKEYLEDTSLKLGDQVRAGTEECREKVNSDLSEVRADIQIHNETLETMHGTLTIHERQMAEHAATNANKISSLSSNISSNKNGIVQVSSKATSNANSISSLSSRISSNSDRISRIISDRTAFSSFTARLTNKLPNSSKNKRIVFDNVITNRGYDYSSSTGIYTAPVTGYYIFLFNVGCYIDKMAHVQLSINGVLSGVDAIAHSTGDAPNHTGGNAGMLYLSKGDKVWVETSSLQSTYDIWPWRTTFSGALLYSL